MCCRQRWNSRSKGGEEQADVDGLLTTWGQGKIRAWAAATGHVLGILLQYTDLAYPRDFSVIQAGFKLKIS